MSLLVCLLMFILFFYCFVSRLDVYIYDYLVKRNLQASAKAFRAEGKVSSDPVGECLIGACYGALEF